MKSLRLLVVVLGVAALCHLASADWSQFGGPRTNFHVEAPKLAESWPPAGPAVLWKRPLGGGYSGITVAGDVLYTMYRNGSQEIVLAAKANTGETIWEFKYDAPFQPQMKMENGSGPHGTPLLTEHGVYVAGILGQLRCLDRASGKVKWEHDLPRDFGLVVPDRGYSPSPIAYRDMLFVKGGQGQGIVALRQRDGAVVWKAGDFSYSGSTPVLGNVGGFDQLIVFAGDGIAALNPLKGDLQWRYPHATDWGLNLSAPVWGEDGIVFCSSAYSGGSQAIQVLRAGDRVESKELWSTNQMRVHFTNAIRIADYVYGSSGDFGPSPLTAINAKTGKIAWKDRTFAKANLLYADGKLIVLDEDGLLALVRVSPEGLQVLSKTSLAATRHWTVPTLAATRLYIRNQREMMALDLAPGK